MDVRVEKRSLTPLKLNDVHVGHVYMTSGGGGPEPDGAYYILADNGALVSLDDGTYYTPQYANHFADWVFYEVDARLVVSE